MKYVLWQTETYEKPKRKRTDIAQHLERLEQKLRENPKTAGKSRRLKGNLQGKREANITGNWRVVFTICEECRQFREQDRNAPNCPDCDKQADNTVNLLFVFDPHGK